MKKTGKMITVIVVFFVICGVAMFSLQRQVIFPRYLLDPRPGAEQGIEGLEQIWIETGGGRVEAWFLPGVGVTESSPGPALFFAHGNAELIEDWPLALDPYRRMGISIVLAEYRGYGNSEGSPSQTAITEDFVAFYELITARPDVDAARIIYHGRSLGGGAVCALANTHPPAAMILQSTFTSVADMAARLLVPRFLVRDPFDNGKVIASLDVPLLITHGRHDEVIPYSHAERMRDLALSDSVTFITYDCGHNDGPPDQLQYWMDIRTFLEQAGLIQDLKASENRQEED